MSDFARRLSLVSLIDVSKDCIDYHKQARANAKEYANRILEDALADFAAQRVKVLPADRRRLALAAQRETKERLGYGLPILIEADGRAHFGAGPHLPLSRQIQIDNQTLIPYAPPVDPERISLADVFKH